MYSLSYVLPYTAQKRKPLSYIGNDETGSNAEEEKGGEEMTEQLKDDLLLALKALLFALTITAIVLAVGIPISISLDREYPSHNVTRLDEEQFGQLMDAINAGKEAGK